jgi:hypothetical protein
MSEFRDFRAVLREHLEAIERADLVCAEAAEARRNCYRAARADGLHPGLLRIIARERRFDEELVEELQHYRETAASFATTPLARAAARTEEEAEEADIIV